MVSLDSIPMPRHALRALTLGATLVLGASAQERPASPWGSDLAAATARATAEQRPLAVVFRCEP